MVNETKKINIEYKDARPEKEVKGDKQVKNDQVQEYIKTNGDKKTMRQKKQTNKDKGDKKEKTKTISFRILNTEGLNLSKYTDIEDNFFTKENEINIVCLTETHKRIEDIYISRKIKTYNTMRTKNDKQGGGLYVLHPKMPEIKLEKVENKNRDLLVLDGKIYELRLRIIIVYFDANKNTEGKIRNNKIKEDIETLIENNKMDGLMIMGDFNGHLKVLDGKEDINGRMLLEWARDYRLTILNLDEKCSGVYTRVRREQKTAIDYAVVNNRIYEIFNSMHIDENKEIIDGSDHTLLTVNLNVRKDKIKKTEWKEIIYYSMDVKDLREFVKELEQEWNKGEKMNLQGRINSIVDKAEVKLKRLRRIKIGGKNKPVKNKWMTEDIRKGIKKGREFNRRKRYGRTIAEISRLTRLYKMQKYRVQKLIRDAKNKYEIKMTKEIKESDNRGKNMWRHINKLSERDQRDKDILEVYEDGKKLRIEEAKNKLGNFWQKLFESEKKELTPLNSGKWNENKIEEITDLYEKENEEARIKGEKIWILQPKPKFMKDNWIRETNKLRDKKAAGTTKIKGEMYKIMTENKTCSEAMIDSLDNVINEKDIPESWKNSWMKLIKKVKKPTVKDFRPITITNISYKIYMSFLRKEVENHLEINGMTKDNQTGFTEGGRGEFNHFMLQFLVEKAYQRKEKLIIITLDYKKAFDSIDRRALIDALIEYRINPYIINLIAKIYSNDKTKICLGELQKEIDRNIGIKQGCTASTTFFKIITYIIMDSVEKKGIEYETEGLKLSTIFFADDSMALAKTKEATKKNLEVIIEISKKFGLMINKEKSKVLIFNDDENFREIEGIEVADKIKYLGIEIDNKRNMFWSQKNNMIKKAEKMEPLTYSTIKKSCNKILVGKNYWKSIVIPTIMYGAGLYNMNKMEIAKLQTKEYDCYRTILGAKKSDAVAAIRGEIGSSLIETRLIESRLLFVRSILNGNNNLVKDILHRTRNDRQNPWKKMR